MNVSICLSVCLFTSLSTYSFIYYSGSLSAKQSLPYFSLSIGQCLSISHSASQSHFQSLPSLFFLFFTLKEEALRYTKIVKICLIYLCIFLAIYISSTISLTLYLSSYLFLCPSTYYIIYPPKHFILLYIRWRCWRMN